MFFVPGLDLLSNQQFEFLWGRAVCGRGFALCAFKNHKISLLFDTFYTTKTATHILFSHRWLLLLKQSILSIKRPSGWL